MDFTQLRHFQTVARLGHMTQAAEALHVAQPALSRNISRLEAELGVALFDRVGRQIQLNEFGETFLRRVNKSFHHLDEGVRELMDLADKRKRIVSIAVNTTLFMPELLTKFFKEYPHIKLRQMLAPTAHIQHLLETGQVDFGITAPSMVSEKNRNIQTEQLSAREVLLAVPPHHRLADRNQISLREVADEAFISMPLSYGIRDMTDAFCHQAGFIPNIVFETDEPSSIPLYVQAGMGIAFIPPYIGESDVMLSVHRLHIIDPICEGTIGLNWIKERYISKAAQQFKEFAVHYFAELTMQK